MLVLLLCLPFFFFNDTATTEIYTLSLHDALPICPMAGRWRSPARTWCWDVTSSRSEEHTSELQSHLNLVCRLLLEKKNNTNSIASKIATSVVTRFPSPVITHTSLLQS